MVEEAVVGYALTELKEVLFLDLLEMLEQRC
jgi:hypothetical protein